MEPLPYFLLLLKKNVVLCSIIAHSSFAQVDLSHIEHITRTDSYMNLLNFQLDGKEIFPSVDVMLIEDATSITFHTTNPDYYDHPEHYFQRSGMERDSHPYIIYGQEAQTRRRNLGNFEIFGPGTPPASVSVAKSTIYGYAIFIDFYKFNMLVIPK